jgi:hypothetical protein
LETRPTLPIPEAEEKQWEEEDEVVPEEEDAVVA